MYRTDKFTPAPTSWDAVFDPAKTAAVQGQGHRLRRLDLHRRRGAVPQGPQARARDHRPVRADPGAVRRGGRPAQGAAPVRRQVLVRLRRRDRQLHQRRPRPSARPGRTRQHARGRPASPVEAIVPTEGMTGWADTWMLSRYAKHPNCMLKWMAWMVTPEVQAQVAEYFGEAPANPKACSILDTSTSRTRSRTSAPRTASTTSVLQRDQLLEDARSATAATAAARPASRTTEWVAAWTGDEGLTRSPTSIRRGRAIQPDPRPRPADESRIADAMTTAEPARPSAAPPPVGLALSTPADPARVPCSSPPIGWFGIVYLGSLALLFVYAFWSLDPLTGVVVKQFTLDNFQQIAQRPRLPGDHPAHGRVRGASSPSSTRSSPSRSPTTWPGSPRRAARALLFMLVLLPLWASYLVRVYAWRVILAPGGPLDWAFQQVGITGVSSVLRRVRRLDDHRVQLHLAAVHDPADLRRARADPALVPRGVGRPRGAERDDVPAGDPAARPAGARRRLDLHVLADPRRLHHPAARLEHASSSATSSTSARASPATSRSRRRSRSSRSGSWRSTCWSPAGSARSTRSEPQRRGADREPVLLRVATGLPWSFLYVPIVDHRPVRLQRRAGPDLADPGVQHEVVRRGPGQRRASARHSSCR